MEEWLHPITKDTVVIIDVMALIIVAIGTVEAFFTGLRVAFPAPAANRRLREVWLRYGRWLVAGLTFQPQPTSSGPRSRRAGSRPGSSARSR
jgi:hypothetical protein